MRPWYRYSYKYDDYPQATIITPFSKLWGYGAPATLILIIINVAIWLGMVITNAAGWLPLESWWYKYFALTPNDVTQRLWIHQLLTSVFLHDGADWHRLDILHLAVNMYLLWVFGPRVERAFVPRTFVLFYLLTGITGSILSLAMRSAMGFEHLPSLGASSAVFGVLTAYGFLFSDDILLLFFFIPIRAWKTVVLFIVLESLFIFMQWLPNVDHWAHLGGAAGSAIWMLILIRMKGHKTGHGWHHVRVKMPGRSKGIHATHVGPPFGGFRIVEKEDSQLRKDHPEGTDDEPPPEWFNLSK